MTSQCPRCLSSFFPRLNSGCLFCIGHWKGQRVRDYATQNGIVRCAHPKISPFEPSILNGLDRTTSGAIGQP